MRILETLDASKLSPEEKARIMTEMSETVTRICIDGIKAKTKNITEQEQLVILRERIQARRT